MSWKKGKILNVDDQIAMNRKNKKSALSYFYHKYTSMPYLTHMSVFSYAQCFEIRRILQSIYSTVPFYLYYLYNGSSVSYQSYTKFKAAYLSPDYALIQPKSTHSKKFNKDHILLPLYYRFDLSSDPRLVYILYHTVRTVYLSFKHIILAIPCAMIHRTTGNSILMRYTHINTIDKPSLTSRYNKLVGLLSFPLRFFIGILEGIVISIFFFFYSLCYIFMIFPKKLAMYFIVKITNKTANYKMYNALLGTYEAPNMKHIYTTATIRNDIEVILRESYGSIHPFMQYSISNTPNTSTFFLTYDPDKLTMHHTRYMIYSFIRNYIPMLYKHIDQHNALSNKSNTLSKDNISYSYNYYSILNVPATIPDSKLKTLFSNIINKYPHLISDNHSTMNLPKTHALEKSSKLHTVNKTKKISGDINTLHNISYETELDTYLLLKAYRILSYPELRLNYTKSILGYEFLSTLIDKVPISNMHHTGKLTAKNILNREHNELSANYISKPTLINKLQYLFGGEGFKYIFIGDMNKLLINYSAHSQLYYTHGELSLLHTFEIQRLIFILYVLSQSVINYNDCESYGNKSMKTNPLHFFKYHCVKNNYCIRNSSLSDTEIYSYQPRVNKIPKEVASIIDALSKANFGRELLFLLGDLIVNQSKAILFTNREYFKFYKSKYTSAYKSNSINISKKYEKIRNTTEHTISDKYKSKRKSNILDRIIDNSFYLSMFKYQFVTLRYLFTHMISMSRHTLKNYPPKSNEECVSVSFDFEFQEITAVAHYILSVTTKSVIHNTHIPSYKNELIPPNQLSSSISYLKLYNIEKLRRAEALHDLGLYMKSRGALWSGGDVKIHQNPELIRQLQANHYWSNNLDSQLINLVTFFESNLNA